MTDQSRSEEQEAADPAPGRRLVVVRPGAEVATKASASRRRAMRRIGAGVKAALGQAGASCRFRRRGMRLLVETDAGDSELAVLDRVFGIGTYSPVEAVSGPQASSVARVGGEVFADRVRGRRYAVRAKRIGASGVSTREIERELGAALNEGATVDLDDPEITVYVEIEPDRAVLFSERHHGVGGLPLGFQGRGLVLLSGGFDSAVASWRTMRRGVATDYLYCNLGGAAAERGVLQVARVLTELWHLGQRPRLHVVDFGPVAKMLREQVRHSYAQVVLKRVMYRVASRLAAAEGHAAVITGESIGQVSSQTLINLRAIDPAAELPVLRPLLGFDKQEIMAEARRVGTAPLSERIREHCEVVPERPVVAASPEQAAAQEACFDDALLDRLVAERRVFDLRAVTPRDMRVPYLFTSEVPADAILIDCQRDAMYKAWHAPSARHFDPLELLDSYRRLDPGQTYVLYCEHGTRTVQLAELMQQDGYEAYAFDGGVARLRRHLDASGGRE